ncbi:MAG: hypothetical protein ACYDAG_18795, partial [Chloroflexota bacterium]
MKLPRWVTLGLLPGLVVAAAALVALAGISLWGGASVPSPLSFWQRGGRSPSAMVATGLAPAPGELTPAPARQALQPALRATSASAAVAPAATAVPRPTAVATPVARPRAGAITHVPVLLYHYIRYLPANT